MKCFIAKTFSRDKGQLHRLHRLHTKLLNKQTIEARNISAACFEFYPLCAFSNSNISNTKNIDKQIMLYEQKTYERKSV